MIYEVTALTRDGKLETITIEGQSKFMALSTAKSYFRRKYNSLDSSEDQFCMTWEEKTSDIKNDK